MEKIQHTDALFTYDLPENLIARQPRDKRGTSRMMHVDVPQKKSAHMHIQQLPDHLQSGDILILNHTQVSPRRITWQYKNREEEIVFLDLLEDHGHESLWKAIVSGKKIALNQNHLIDAEHDIYFQMQSREGVLAEVKITCGASDLERFLNRRGELTIPPYIRKARQKCGESLYSDRDREGYQTVFSQRPGAVAAPTAGLHLTHSLLNEIKAKGVKVVEINLEVSWGTFAPLGPHHFQENRLHEEKIEIYPESAREIREAKREGRHVVCVGTTSLRAVEHWANQGMPEDGFSGTTDLFIRPPWTPKVATALLTNFHLPGSSLLLLVEAFLGNRRSFLESIYRDAIDQHYQFFSYGDCMLLSRATGK